MKELDEKQLINHWKLEQRTGPEIDRSVRRPGWLS